MALDFAVTHWDRIAPVLEPSTEAGYMPRLLTNATDTALIARLDAFARDNIPESARQDLRKIESNVRYLARVRSERLPEADRWIAAHPG